MTVREPEVELTPDTTERTFHYSILTFINQKLPDLGPIRELGHWLGFLLLPMVIFLGGAWDASPMISSWILNVKQV